MAQRVAGGLASLGIGKGDTVALMLNNRWEFIPCDLATVFLGGVPFSIYQTSSPEQIQYVCEDAEVTVAIVEESFREVFEKARENLPKLKTLIVIDGEPQGENEMTLAQLEEIDPDFDIDATRQGGRARRPADADLHLGHDRARRRASSSRIAT